MSQRYATELLGKSVAGKGEVWHDSTKLLQKLFDLPMECGIISLTEVLGDLTDA